MSLAELRRQVLEANLDLVRRGLVLSTFGNASGVDRKKGLIVIKPSGVPYDKMKVADLVVTDLDGKIIEGKLRPSSDLATHAALYRAFPAIGGVAHTHSEYATAWAQARKPIPCFGTTHADYFHGAVPVTDPMSKGEIDGDYELNTGTAIIRTVKSGGHDVMSIPAMLVANHGPFAWGTTPHAAAENAWMLEAAARIAFLTVNIHPHAVEIDKFLHDRHFLRKHGTNAYYGQTKSKH
jgi:L-ribulose-5-phosphate 4-epimerase